MTGWAAFLGALLASVAGGLLVEALVRLPREPFALQMRRRGLRMTGRIVVVLVVVAALVGAGGASPLASAGGALLGWLLVAGREARTVVRPDGGDGE